MEEIWKDIKGFENLYQVSNYGRVKSLYRELLHPKNGIAKYESKILKHSFDKDGYPKLTITLNGKHHYVRVHRLVAQTFIENPHNKPYINHIDAVRGNNRVENLEWVTAKENSSWSIKLNRHIKGENMWKHIFTEKEVIDLLIYFRDNKIENMAEFCRQHGYKVSTINCIRNRLTWKHIDINKTEIK
jgi:hypothetical protein